MLKIEKNVSLAAYTNYKIGGNARYFCKVGNKQEIFEALAFAQDKKVPVFLLGGGANVLISDKGFNGIVIKLELTDFTLEGNKIIAGSGVVLGDMVNLSLKNDLMGLEWAAGIPGTIGGAIRGNAGAFEGEMKDIVKKVVIIENASHKTTQLSNKELGFGYRTSIIKEKGGIILSATLELKKAKDKDESKEIKKIAEKYAKYRKIHHPLEYPSCGSMFKNVKKGEILKNKEALGDISGDMVPAAILIAKAGLIGKKIGDAQISEKHSNFIINLGKAKAKDVLDLIKLCQKEVYGKFGVKLNTEVQLVRFD